MFTQTEIIEMAKQAGFPFNKYDLLQGDDEGEIDAHEMLEAFAKLVAAKERDAFVELIKSHGPTLANGFMLIEAIRARGEA